MGGAAAIVDLVALGRIALSRGRCATRLDLLAVGDELLVAICEFFAVKRPELELVFDLVIQR